MNNLSLHFQFLLQQKSTQSISLLFLRTIIIISILLFALAISPTVSYADNAPVIKKIEIVEGGEKEIVVHAREFVKNTIHIPGGVYSEPYIIDKAETEYILDGDIVADGDAILIRASKIVLNLNGKTVTYNQKEPGHGVRLDVYNKTDIAVINGSIIQGEAMSEGNQSGAGNNPFRTLGTSRLQIAGIHAVYGGRDVGGIFATYAGDSVFEHITLEDTWAYGTFKNRHQGISAIRGGNSSIYRYNTIINARQAGITVRNDSQVYGNNITINSLATNSAGIGGYKSQDVEVFGNTIVARGEHPIGIGFVSQGTNNIHIHNNKIDVQTTKIGEEYGGRKACFNPRTPCGNFAVGFRTTWGGNNINFHDNVIMVRTDSRYPGTYSVTGEQVVVDGKGRGLMVATVEGERAHFHNNTITALDKDGTGKAFGIACNGGSQSPDLVFENNTVVSNILNVAISDEYGACEGHPLFINNTFVRRDDFGPYQTIAAELGGYFPATGRFVSNYYMDGASQDNININAQNRNKPKSVFFGNNLQISLNKNNNLSERIEEAKITLIHNEMNQRHESDLPQELITITQVTDSNGQVKIAAFEYELHNEDGEAGKEIRRTLQPYVIEVVIGNEIHATEEFRLDIQYLNELSQLRLYKDGSVESDMHLVIAIDP